MMNLSDELPNISREDSASKRRLSASSDNDRMERASSKQPTGR